MRGVRAISDLNESDMLETMQDIDIKLRLLNYSVEDIVRDFEKALSEVDVEQNWWHTMTAVRRIATCGTRAFARVYAHEPGEPSQYNGIMRFLLAEAVRRLLQFKVAPGEERMMWITILGRFRSLEQESMKGTTLTIDNLWQPFEKAVMTNWVPKMDKYHGERFGSSWLDNLA